MKTNFKNILIIIFKTKFWLYYINVTSYKHFWDVLLNSELVYLTTSWQEEGKQTQKCILIS